MNINFILHVFPKILQRYRKLVILGTLDMMLSMMLPTCRKLRYLSACQR